MQIPALGIAAAITAFAVWSAPTVARQHAEYTAHMNASLETPPNTSHASGTVTLTVSGSELHYVVTVGGLSGPATAAHIHVGAPGVAGPPVLTLTVKHVADGIVADDSVDLMKEVSKGVSGDSLRALMANGNAYVNVHTATNPGGEIRGQVVKP
jgi:hypothetical protein